jgi:hypothetical protein
LLPSRVLVFLSHRPLKELLSVEWNEIKLTFIQVLTNDATNEVVKTSTSLAIERNFHGCILSLSAWVGSFHAFLKNKSPIKLGNLPMFKLVKYRREKNICREIMCVGEEWCMLVLVLKLAWKVHFSPCIFNNIAFISF